MTLKIAPSLTFDIDAAAQVFAFLGRRGSGKTYAAGRFVEELHAAGAQVVILDPVGVWWGLRLDRDGKKPGLQIPVFGGQHGDIPLEASAGKVVAQLVAEKGVSLVLDVSEFTGTDQRRFVGEFAAELLHAKKQHRSALMVVMEEAQEFAPQLVRPDYARMVGAVEKMVKLGRNFGIGTAMISQRPQAVNKDILNQTECLFAFQLTGPQERKAIEGWVQEKGADRSIVGELPGLPVGTAMVWSPQWLGIFGKYAILPKRTYDASATPGAAPVRTAALAAIDLEAVSAAMAATIEKAKADDPKELKRLLAIATKERDTWQGLAERATAAAEKSTEGWMQEAEVEAFVVRRMSINAAKLGAARTAIEDASRLLNEWLSSDADLDEEVVISETLPVAPRISGLSSGAGGQSAAAIPGPKAHRNAPLAADHSDGDGGHKPPSGATGRVLSKAERAVLSVLAQYPNGIPKQPLTILTGYSYSGGFRNTLSALRVAGYIVGNNNDVLSITPEGFEALGPYDPLPVGDELLQYWLRDARLSKADRLALDYLASIHPRALPGPELAVAVGYEYSGGFRNTLSKLRTLRLIEGQNSSVRASGVFFGDLS